MQLTSETIVQFPERRGEQLVLPAEAFIDVCFVEPGCGGDGLGRCFYKPLLGNDMDGALNERLSDLFLFQMGNTPMYVSLLYYVK